jgi:class 3 adenylate cyclase
MMSATTPRVLFPLWAKLGLLFGSLSAAMLGANGWVDLTRDRAHQLDAQRRSLRSIAVTLAGAIDGQAHASLLQDSDSERPVYARTMELLETGRGTSSDADWVGTCTRDADGHWHYAVDSDSAAPIPIGFPIFDGYAARNQAWDEDRVVFVSSLEDEWGVWRTAFAPIHDAEDRVTGLVEVVVDAHADELRAGWLVRTSILQVLAAILLSWVLSLAFAKYLGRNITHLTEAALAVARGDLDREIHVHSHDEIGALGRAFEQMVQGLREREHIRETFGRFVDKRVVERALADPEGLRLGGQQRRVTVLMSDLRGFTALAEEVGPEKLIQVLNRYFSRMGRIIDKHDGTLAEILGDGMVCFFGAPVLGDDDARRAVLCAIDLYRGLEKFNRFEKRNLQMGVGICTGDVIVGNIGSEQQMKYGVVGNAINLAARLESCTVGNQILIDDLTRDLIDDIAIGEALSLSVKGRRGALVAHPVRSVGESHMPAERDEEWKTVDAPAEWREVEGKQLSDQVHVAQFVGVSDRSIRLASDTLPDMRASVKINANLGDGRQLEEVYGTVSAVENGAMVLRVTSATDDERALLRQLLR